MSKPDLAQPKSSVSVDAALWRHLWTESMRGPYALVEDPPPYWVTVCWNPLRVPVAPILSARR